MDAFSIALAYGTNNIKKNKILIASIFVGLFHFFMPILGYTVFSNLFQNFSIQTNLLVGVIFLLLTLEMILSLKEEKDNISTKILALLIYAFTVSIDSFTVGIAISLEKSNIIMAGITFSIISFIFTLVGMLIGKYLTNLIGKKAKIIGIIILLIFTVKYLIL